MRVIASICQCVSVNNLIRNRHRASQRLPKRQIDTHLTQ